MQTTSLTLLERVRQPNDQSAWDRFVSLYSPLLFAFARRAGMDDSDAADVVQDVFMIMMAELPSFEYDANRKNFRGWLKTITVNKCRERQRRLMIATAQGGDEGGLSDGEYDLTFSATAPAQPDWLGLGLVWRGRPCVFFVDSRHADLQRVAGKPSTQNETKVDGRLVAPGEKIEIVCQVRHDGLTILKDGEELLKWQGDPARLSAAEDQAGLGNAMPTLRCPPGWTIHAWTLTPRGQGMSPAALRAIAKPNAVRQLLDDGYHLAMYDEGRGLVFQGDYPAQALLPANERITRLQGTLNRRALQAATQLPNLERLRFNGGYLTPEFVPQLNQHTLLKELQLPNLNIRDDDLANLTLHDKLEFLALSYNPLTLTDGLLDQLASSRSLRQLDLSGNSASEESLMRLDRLVQLESLYLIKSQVADRVLDRLQTLPNLKLLNITATPATAARVEAFRKAKPNCQVEWLEKK